METFCRPSSEANCIRALKESTRRKRQAIVLDQAHKRAQNEIKSAQNEKKSHLESFWQNLERLDQEN